VKDYAANDRAENDDLNLWHGIVLKTLDLQGKRVMDVGAGTGRFLDAARTAGAAEVFAVDPNAHHASFFRSRGIPFHIGYLTPAIPFEPDVLTCFEVIEHVYDPNPIMAAAHTLLRPSGGTLVLSTPNAFNAMRAAKFVLHQRHLDPLMDPVVNGAGAEHIRAYSFGMVADLMILHGFKNPRPLSGGPLRRFLTRGIVMSADA
jgi:2-polyprenyl-3-methyl-5-hydroxy-6-metoxy-1,4-benzoquinol methylase